MSGWPSFKYNGELHTDPASAVSIFLRAIGTDAKLRSVYRMAIQTILVAIMVNLGHIFFVIGSFPHDLIELVKTVRVGDFVSPHFETDNYGHQKGKPGNDQQGQG